MEMPLELVKVYFDGAEMPIENIHITIDRIPNQHDRAVITGYMKDGHADRYVQIANERTEIEVKFLHDDEDILKFCGLVDDIKVHAEGIEDLAVHHIRIVSLAHTSKLDIKKVYKSLQYNQQTVDDELWEVLEPYPDADFKNEVCPGEMAGCFRLIYRETLHEYIVRRASKYNAPVICISNLNRARFRFGITEFIDKGSIEKYDYTVDNDVTGYRKASQNHEYEDVQEIDFVKFTIFLRENEAPLDIGDMVTYRDIPVIVNQAHIEIKDNYRYCTYYLGTQNSFKVRQKFNEQIVGLSLVGKVIAIENDGIKLHLEIDEVQEVDKAWRFGYLTSYATKYVMPEINDYVQLYFPNQDEGSGVGMSSIKQIPEEGYMRNGEPPIYPLAPGSHLLDFIEEAHDPDTKMFVSKYGQAIALCKDATYFIEDDDNYIKLKRGEGTTIYTKNKLRAQADQDIEMKAQKEIRMTAENSILIHSGTSKVEVMPDLIKIRSTETDLN